MSKPQRIRDPVHNIVNFDGRSQFEETMWNVVQTRPFQRLRRIKQLGFSELVFPGATHSRFAHSVGVFHVARLLMTIIERGITSGAGVFGTFNSHKSQVALAAALVHDVGHGMFSHAFERFGTEYQLNMAEHEHVSDILIRGDEICHALQPLGASFADEVAAMIKAKQPESIYSAAVSSQFDADRLDYVQRDRLMTGVQSSQVDVSWLLSNLEVGEVRSGSDDDESQEVIQTLVFGPKARQTAESYVVSLLHLYQNVYGHKATRGAETVFFVLLARLKFLHENKLENHSNLPKSHPLLRFMTNPEKVENAVALDDTVFWGALPQMTEASDSCLQKLARRLWDRKLPNVIDVRRIIEEKFPPTSRENLADRKSRLARIGLVCGNVKSSLEDRWRHLSVAERPVNLDTYTRSPYRRFDAGSSPINQMQMRQGVSFMTLRRCRP